MSRFAWDFFKIPSEVIKHQGGAGEDREGRAGGLWCSLVASGLTTGRGQVGSRPGVAAED